MSACVAFGPNDSHIFNSPKQWSMSGLPAGMNALFNGQTKIKEIHEVALGPDGSYILTYSHQAGMSLLHSGVPPALERWLMPVPGHGVTRDIPSLQIVLGPGGSYFAFDKNASAWGSLPKPLNDAVEARRDATGRFRPNEGPANVALGPDGAYVFITTGGGGFWNLYHQNDILQQFLHDRPSLHGVHVILSPCRPGVYVTLIMDGNCAGSVLTTQHPQYLALAADWKVTCETTPLRPVATHSQSTSSAIPLAGQYQTSPIAATSPITAPYRTVSAPVMHHPTPVHHTPVRVAAPHPPAAHHRASSSAFSGQNILHGLKLANNLAHTVNVLDGNAGGGGGGGGDAGVYSGGDTGVYGGDSGAFSGGDLGGFSGGDSGGFSGGDSGGGGFGTDILPYRTIYVDISYAGSTDKSAAANPMRF